MRLSSLPTGLKMFHGSPNGELDHFRGVAFFTRDKHVAEQYASGKVFGASNTNVTQPTIYFVNVMPQHILDMRNEQARNEYDKARVKWNRFQTDPDEQAPKLDSEGFIHRQSGLPSFGYVGLLHEMLPSYDSIWIDEGGHLSLAVFNPKQKVQILDKETLSPSL